MSIRKPLAAACAVFLSLAATNALASVSAEKAAQLGNQLTPTGAELDGNAAGTIPKWTGGETTPPPGWTSAQDRYADPYPDDKPLFTITAANLDKYKDNLTDGQIALFKKWPNSYKMNIYPTRRSFAAPQWVYDAVKVNAENSALANDGESLTGATGGVPFPFPKATSNPAKAVIWNHKLRYRGSDVRYISAQLVTTPGGGLRTGKLQLELKFPYNQKGIKPSDLHNISIYFLETVLAPPRSAGAVLLVHETIDQVAETRRAWLYNPGQRRIRRAPSVAYDNPGTDSDGMRTNDQFDMYNGATDRYNWELLGKKEVYIPYNSYKLETTPKYSDIVGKEHTNQDLMRYELHRVWVVEGTVKPTTSHIYAKRKFYVDEDSWHIAAADQWDARGELWRVMEGHTIELYDQPYPAPAMESSYDLSSNRYLLMSLNNEEGRAFNNKVRYNDDYFNPRNIQRRASK